jgi:arginase
MTEPWDRLRPGDLALLGLPSDEHSSFLKGAALAPPRIREVLYSGASNLSAENGLDLGSETRFHDLGDLDFEGVETFQAIESSVRQVLARGAALLSLGGDHALTYPLVKAYAAVHGPLEILHLDAHPDLYDVLDGDRYSHACPFARIMEAGLARRLVQVGIRTMNPHQRQQAARFGVEVHDMRHWRPDFQPDLAGPIYLSLDMDVLDPAFVPGVSHQEPGGLTTRELLGLIHGLGVPMLGADIVEFNPARDPAGVTAAAAAKLLKEVAACMLAWSGESDDGHRAVLV